MKKGDIIIIISVAAATLIGIIAVFALSGKGSSVVIQQNNKAVYKTSLSQNDRIKLSGNTVVIENGEVYVESADCKNQICVKHKKISAKGERIVCLPNKVTVEIK